MSIVYPEFFEEKLALNRRLRAAVDGTVSDFGGWLKDSKLPFFTDYTDHGPDHLSQVLRTAVALIASDARPLFTPGDTAVFILATLLHDAALHLSEAGFQELINGKAAEWQIADFDSTFWADLWRDFLFSAKRWDDHKLIKVFGEAEQGGPRATVRDPFESYHNLSDSDRKLIGEFIRLHHPRMAHEFAVFGVPGPSSDPIRADAGFGADLCDIGGLVARSHGLPVRTCLDYLSEKHHLREYKGVHTVFLMTLLRVADYLQIQADRAPAIAFRYKAIYSRTSEQEWKAHHAIKNITRTNDDPESIEIQAEPKDVHTFLRLKEWLNGIQTELDASWAVLGEVYGRQEKLRKLGLILRRVRSNLDDVEKFAETEDISYVPQRIEFTVKRPDLLKLLIRPLYGNKPEIGIRELMQNSIDAVRELWVMQGKRPELKNVPLIRQKGDVEIWLDDPDETGYAWLTVSDRGIGMTPEVVHDYFLKAGASYRRSEAWQREFETDEPTESDETEARSQVLRSGRFGIGALAAFLLGDELEVTTRHISCDSGVRFTTKLDLEPIQLEYDRSLPVGTTIRIKVSSQVQQRLARGYSSGREPGQPRWDWYCFDSPDVRRLLGKHKKELPPRYRLTYGDLGKPSRWRELPKVDSTSIYWSYDKVPSLNCNGIVIRKSTASRKIYKTNYLPKRIVDDSFLQIRTPNMTILDPDGAFPLNLQREEVNENQFAFDNLLVEEVIKDVLGFLLVNAPEFLKTGPLWGVPSHPALEFRSQFDPWFAVQNGLCVIDPWNISQVAIRSILIIVDCDEPNVPIRLSSDIHHDAFLRYGSGYEATSIFLGNLVRSGYYPYRNSQIEVGIGGYGLIRFGVKQARIITNPGVMKALLSAKDPGKKPYPSERERYNDACQKIQELFEPESKGRNWATLVTKGCPTTKLHIDRLGKLLAQTKNTERHFPCFVELFSIEASQLREPGILGRFWRDIIQHPVIPFDPKERRDKLAYAYEVLKPYVEAHEVMKKSRR